jgi:hypothetical protein
MSDTVTTTTTLDKEIPPHLKAELAALEALAARHRSEYVRLRTIELAKLRGESPRFTRDRMTREQLAELPPVTDVHGVELRPGQRVKCPDGVHARVVRVDKRSKRAVVERQDGQTKMTVSRRLTVMGVRRAPSTTAAA